MLSCGDFFNKWLFSQKYIHYVVKNNFPRKSLYLIFFFSHGMCILCIANMLLPSSSKGEFFVFQWLVLLLFDFHFIEARFFFFFSICVLSFWQHIAGRVQQFIPTVALAELCYMHHSQLPCHINLFWGLSLQCIHSVSWWNFSGRIYKYSFEVVMSPRDQTGLFLVTALVPAVTRALSVKAVHVMVTKCRFLCSRFCKYSVVSTEKHPVRLQRWAVYVAEQPNSYWTFLF